VINPNRRNRTTMNNRSLLALIAAVAILAPAAAQAATPMLGVPVQIRRGFYTETDLGAFFTMGGQGQSPSNAQAYIALGLGYDILGSGGNLLSVGASVGMASSAGACFASQYGNGAGGAATCLDAGGQPFSDNWTATTVEGSLLYGRELASRLMGTVRLIGGLAFLQPLAFEGYGDQLPIAGAGVGLEYATQFDHFSLGLDVAGKMFVGPNKLGVAIAPRIKYTF
jgi:hypothetical protein